MVAANGPLPLRNASRNRGTCLNGSREGLFSAIFIALARKRVVGRPAVLIPNPFYQAYAAATTASGAEPMFLPSGADTGFLPDLDVPQVPLPIQHVSVAAWADEAYVEAGRALYRANFDLADGLLADRYGYWRPAGSFFFVARHERQRRRRGRDENPLERVWCQSAPGQVSRPRGSRRDQSRHGFRQGRARA